MPHHSREKRWKTLGNFLLREFPIGSRAFSAPLIDVLSGGKLLLFELTLPTHLLSGYVFGLLPGWWLSKFSENRTIS
jgi:hypothetical protein